MEAAMAKPEPDLPTMWLQVKAPVELFERLDRWRERYKSEHASVMAPSRQAAIRWIVHNFLLKQEQKASRRSKTAKKRRARW
jgi:hypothetical protein